MKKTKTKKLLIFFFPLLLISGCSKLKNLNLEKTAFLNSEFKKINKDKDIFIDLKIYKNEINNTSLIKAEYINLFNEIYLKKFEDYLATLIKNNPKLKQFNENLNNNNDKYAKIIFFYNLEEKIKNYLLKNAQLYNTNCNKKYCIYKCKINKLGLYKHVEKILKKYYLILHKEEKKNIKKFFVEKVNYGS